MILIRAIPFCQVSKQGIRSEGNAIIGFGGWKYAPGNGLPLCKFDGRDGPLAIVAPDRNSQTVHLEVTLLGIGRERQPENPLDRRR
jgi:hypothetical protein